MPFQVYLSPTTASPPDAQVQAYVRAAITAEGAGVDPDGVTVRTPDGARVRLAGDDEHFLVDQLSPVFCRIVFNAALRSNSTVDRGGSDVTPLKMKGAHGATKYIRMRTDLVVSPVALCDRLERDRQEWEQIVSDSQKGGVMGPNEEILEPPASPGTEARLDTDASGVGAHCSATFAKSGWKIVASILSQNAQYGVVWRADVTLPAYPHILSRLICWRRPGQGPDSYAVEDRPLEMFDPAQSVAPLASEARPGGR